MKKWKIIFILAFLAIVVVFFLVYRAMQDRALIEEVKRNYKPGYVDYVRSFPTSFHVAELKFYKGRLFLYNTSDMQIVETDTLGGIIRHYGKKGDSQEEFELITGWDVDEHGVYIMDGRKLAITEIDSGDKVTLRRPVKVLFNRAHRVGNKKYIVKYTDSLNIHRQVFQLLDLSSDIEKILDYSLQRFSNDIEWDGFFIKAQGGESYYLCHWMGLFFCIDSNAAFVYKRETVDRTPPPEIYTGGGGMSIDPDAKLVNISASTDQKNLYILSRAYTSTDDSTAGVVDVYDRKTGDYAYSFTIPPYEGKRPRAMARSDDGLYVVQGSSIVHYRFTTPSE
jgi:hypothetical protein